MRLRGSFAGQAARLCEHKSNLARLAEAVKQRRLVPRGGVALKEQVVHYKGQRLRVF